MRKRNKKAEDRVTRKQNKSSKWLLLWKRAQSAWADWMQKKTTNMSQRTLVVLLFLFISCSIVLNCFILTGHFIQSDLEYGTVSQPVNLYHLEDNSKSLSVEQELAQMRDFRRYMDSLNLSPQGKLIYDSIVSAHPGLLDSVKQIENLLSNQ